MTLITIIIIWLTTSSIRITSTWRILGLFINSVIFNRVINPAHLDLSSSLPSRDIFRLSVSKLWAHVVFFDRHIIAQRYQVIRSGIWNHLRRICWCLLKEWRLWLECSQSLFSEFVRLVLFIWIISSKRRIPWLILSLQVVLVLRRNLLMTWNSWFVV